MSTAIEFFVLLIAGSYFLFLLIAYSGFVFSKKPTAARSHEKKIAVVIAVRNEEKNIVALLNALEEQTFTSSFEVIICDDHSEDETVKRIRGYHSSKYKLSVFSSPGKGKKAALTHAIAQTDSELILVTDGDCIPGRNWISSYAELFADDDVIFAGGLVQYENRNDLLRRVLQTEMLFLQVTSAGLHEYGKASMCNGASMAFTRSFFVAQRGFEGNDFVSGDDVFLLQKAMRINPKGVRWNYSREAIVKTAAAETIREAIVQRHRWISKLRGYGAGLLSAGLFFVLVQLLLPAAIVASIVYGSVFNPFVYGFALKTLVELLLLSLTAPYFREHKIIPAFPLSVILYDVISLCAAVKAVRNEASWKGRKWKQGKTV